MTIPHRDLGYSIELDTVIVHERYQDHAPTAVRTRSMLGVINREVQTGIKPTACPQCFPPPAETKRVRRYYSRPEPEVTTEPSTSTDTSVRVEPEPDSTTEAAGG